MSRIRYIGHDPHNRIPKEENDVFQALTRIIETEAIFTSLHYDNLLEEFKVNWKTYVRKDLEQHINFVEFWQDDIVPANMVVIYPTDIANGRVYIKSMIVPSNLLNKPESKGRISFANKMKFQLNIEIGVFEDDHTNTCVLENLYITAS